MTREQQVALDAMRSAWPEEVVQRMLTAEKPGALLVDHGADLAEAYYLLCAMMGWTYVMDSLSPKHDILRAARVLAETKPGPYGGEPVGELDEYERKAVRRPFSPPETSPGASTPRLEGETA